MIDNRFSSPEFERRGVDTQESKRLADDLENEIALEMDRILKIHFLKIIDKLNSMGHDLKIELSDIGEASYRDDFETPEGYKCKLRVAYDGIVSVGYAHLISKEEVENEGQTANVKGVRVEWR